MKTPTLSMLLEHDQHLEIWCCRHGCHRQARWTAQEAVERLGATCTFAQAARRLRCDACGARGRFKEVTCRPCVLDFWTRQEAAWAAWRQD